MDSPTAEVTMFPKVMQIVCLALTAVCVFMTVADFWNMSSPNLKSSMGIGIVCTALSWGLVKLWGFAARSV